MLQFIAKTDKKYSIAEQVQMAIEGGCKWVQLRVPDLSDAEIREMASEVIPLCKEGETILTIENNIEMAKELGIHGVHLRGSQYDAAKVRELLGPEAVIGVEVGIASSALPLAGADVDYVTFPESMNLDTLSENIEALRNADFLLPIVAETNTQVKYLADYMAARANGIAMSSRISDAADPVRETQIVIETLEKYKMQ